MRVMVTIQHPGHVHFFKHAIEELTARGHEVFTFARENEMTTDLLAFYGIEHEVLARPSNSLVSLAAVQATYELRLLRRARRIRPDVITAIGGVAAAHVSTLVDATSAVFYDTEHARIIRGLAFPFADLICTPECYRDAHGRGHLRYPGFHELAYLHPDRFTPAPDIRDELGVAADQSLVICRFSSWDSSHDVGHGGFDTIRDVVASLEDRNTRVIVSSEIGVDDELQAYDNPIGPHRMHDLLATADLVVSEGATTAAEAAVLGTPAIYVNSLRMGYTDELASRYGLLYSFNGTDRHERGIDRAHSVLQSAHSSTWAERVQQLHADTMDVTDVIVNIVEQAPRADQIDQRSLLAHVE